MIRVYTNISYGYLPLIEIFITANDLEVTFEECKTRICILYKENSDTALSITMLSYKHMGFENMLHDYLIRCGILPSMVPIGKYVHKKTSEQADTEWAEHRKKLGFR